MLLVWTTWPREGLPQRIERIYDPRMTRLSGALAVLGGTATLLVLGVVAPAYADGDLMGPGPGSGPPGWFVGMFVLVVILGIGTTIWRVSTAQRLAKQSGMDPGLATQMTLLSEDGLDATYLAANLRGTEATSQATPPPTATTAARLEELKGLLDRGLITQAEYDARRKAIIDSV